MGISPAVGSSNVTAALTVTATTKALAQQVLKGFAAMEGAVNQPCMFGAEIRYVLCSTYLYGRENLVWVGEKPQDWQEYAQVKGIKQDDIRTG